jgi:putative redox protein
MVQIDVAYQGQLRCDCTHGPSQTHLSTDAPRDNIGKGESFSPTDLLATALGSCMLTTMGIVALRNNLDIAGATIKVEKHMTTTGPRRIARLPVTLHVPHTFSPEDQQRLENAARTCPVYKSIHTDIDAPLTITWG